MCDRARGLRADHLQAKTIVMFAAILINNAYQDAVGADLDIGRKARDPYVRTRLHLGPRLLCGLVPGEYLLVKKIRPPPTLHPYRPLLPAPILYARMRAAA